jgi:hypothetical protein
MSMKLGIYPMWKVTITLRRASGLGSLYKMVVLKC